jgi:hypothetical protein
MEELPQRDPIRADQRRAASARRVGINARCACGETRPEALVVGIKPVICAECQRKKQGKCIMDNHHIAGKANSPATIAVPVNIHRAELSTAQYDWPKETLANPEGSPLLKGAACIRGASDLIVRIIKDLILWIAEMLEILDSYLITALGQTWWVNTELSRFVSKKSSDAAQ